MLIPHALALLIVFSTPQAAVIVPADAGIQHRDVTFFRAQDGTSTYSDFDVIPWAWQERTRVRVQDAYDFCLTVGPSLRRGGKKRASEGTELAGQNGQEHSDGLEQVLAAAGSPSVPPLAKCGGLSD